MQRTDDLNFPGGQPPRPVEALLQRARELPTAAWVVVAVALLLARAGARLLAPEVWDEDGTRNLAGFLLQGAESLLVPVNGYLITLPKLLTMAAASITLVKYPLVSTLFAWAFTVWAFVFLARAPLALRGGPLLLVLAALVPTDPEVFGLPLYTFWWSALLLMALTCWDPRDERWWLRAAIVALASLSSPVCLVTLPLFLARAAMFRRSRAEWLVAAVACLSAALQLASMWPIAKGGALTAAAVVEVVPRFIGGYFVANLLPALKWPAALVALVYLGLNVPRVRPAWPVVFTAYLFGAGVLMSITRVDVQALDPALAGPRYFFLPFILLGWLILQVCLASQGRWMRVIGAALLGLAVANSIPVLTRSHDRLDWTAHLYSCPHFAKYDLPVHYDGVAARAWSAELPGSVCAARIASDPMARRHLPKQTYPFRTIRLRTGELAPIHLPAAGQVLQDGWGGGDFAAVMLKQASVPPGYAVIGSFRTGDADTGVLVLRLHRGDRLLYRTGPAWMRQRVVVSGAGSPFLPVSMGAQDWVVLDFSNDLLPDTFDVQFIDEGNDHGEWSAIARAR